MAYLMLKSLVCQASKCTMASLRQALGSKHQMETMFRLELQVLYLTGRTTANLLA